MLRVVFTAVTKITFSVGALLLFAGMSSNHRAETQLGSAWERLQQRDELRGASMGFCLIDAQNGEAVFTQNPDLLLVPASTLKMLTLRAALLEHGPQHRFETRLEAHGMTEQRTNAAGLRLVGDLVIRPSGDPTINSAHLSSNNIFTEWVDALQKAEITHIEGDLVIDMGAFKGAPLVGSTSIEDAGNYYGAGTFAFNFNDNEGEVVLQSGPTAGDLVSVVSVSPWLSDVVFDCRVLSANDSRDRAFIHGRPFDHNPVIYGTIPKGQQAFSIRAALPNPPQTALAAFQAALKEAKITHSGTLRLEEAYRSSHPAGKAVTLHTHSSPTLREVVAVTGQKSINFYAAALLRSLSVKAGDGAFEVASRRMVELLDQEGMDTYGLSVADGSGLSRLNMVTARQLAQSCKRMKNEDADKALASALKPFAGIPGVAVKSGYIERVRAYCGRVRLPDGQEFAFGLVLNNFTCSPTAARKAIEDFLRHIPNP